MSKIENFLEQNFHSEMADQGRRSFAYSHLSDSQINAPEVHIGMNVETDDLEAFSQLAFLQQEPLFETADTSIRAVLEAPNNPEYLRSLSVHLYRRCRIYRRAAYEKSQQGAYTARPDFVAQLSVELRNYDTLVQDLHHKVNTTVGDKTELCTLLMTRYERLVEKTKEVTAMAHELEAQLQNNDPALRIDYTRTKADITKILQGLEATTNEQTHTIDVSRLRADVQRAISGEGVIGLGSEGYYTIPKPSIHTTAHTLRRDRDTSNIDSIYSPVQGLPNMLGSTIRSNMVMDADSQQLMAILAEVVTKCNLFRQAESDRMDSDHISDAISDPSININDTDSLATCVYKLNIAVDNAITRAKASLNQRAQELSTLRGHVHQLQDDNHALSSQLNEYMNIKAAFENYQREKIEESTILKRTFDQTLLDYASSIKDSIFELKVAGNQGSRQWYADNVMFPHTRTASIVEVLYETYGLLQQYSGREELNLDIQIAEPAALPELVSSNQLISSDAMAALRELQKIGALVASLRYAVEGCIDSIRNKRSSSLTSSPLSEATFMQQMGISMLSIIQSLLSMTLWGSKEKMKEHLGMQTAELLMKKVLMIDNIEVPDGFIDDELSKKLVAIMQQISPTNADLLPLLESLARILEDATKGDYIVPKAVSQLSTLTLNVDKENNQFRQMIDLKDKEILSLQEQVKRKDTDFRESQEQLEKCKNQLQDAHKEMLSVKDGYAASALEAQRAITMDKILEESKQQVNTLLTEKQGLEGKMMELRADNKKLVTIIQAKEANIGELKADLAKAVNELNRQTSSAASSAQNMKEATDRNRELVTLANTMGARLKDTESKLKDANVIITNYNQEKAKYERDIQELTGKCDELRKKYETSEISYSELKIEKMRLETEWKGVLEQCEKLKRQKEELLEELDGAKEAYTNANKDRADATATQQRAVSDLTILTEEYNILSENNIMLDKKCSELTAKLVMAEQEIGNLTDLLNEAHTSLIQYSKDAESKRHEATNATRDLMEAKATAAEGRATTEGLTKEVARLEEALNERKAEYNALNDQYKKEVCDLTARLREAEIQYTTMEQTLRSEYDQLMTTRMQQQLSTVETNASVEVTKYKDQLTAADARYKEALEEIKKYYIDKTEAEKQLSEMKAKLAVTAGNETRLVKMTKILSAFKRKIISLAMPYEKIAESSEGKFKYSVFSPDLGFNLISKAGHASESSFLLDDEPSMIMEERITGANPYDSAPLNAVAQVNVPHERDVEEICTLLKAGIKYQYDHEEMKHLRSEMANLKAEVDDERRKTELVEREKMQLDIELHKAHIENRDLATTVSATRSASVGSFGGMHQGLHPASGPTYPSIDRAQSQRPSSPQSNLMYPSGAASMRYGGSGTAQGSYSAFSATPSGTALGYTGKTDFSAAAPATYKPPIGGLPGAPSLPRTMGYNAPSTLVSAGGAGVTMPNAVGGLLGGVPSMPPLGPGAQSYLHGLGAGLGFAGSSVGATPNYSRSASNPSVPKAAYPAMISSVASLGGSAAGSLVGSTDMIGSQRSISTSGRPSIGLPSSSTTYTGGYTPLAAGMARPGVSGIGFGAPVTAPYGIGK